MAIGKYYYFRKFMDLISDECEVTDADMNYYPGAFKIVGESEEQFISISVTIEKKEEIKNGNEDLE